MNRKLIFAGLIIVVILIVLALRGSKKETVEVVEQKGSAVEVQKAVTVTVDEFIDATGSLKPKFSADVRSEVSGVVRDVHVTDWVYVKKGQPLARIDSEELKAYVSKAKAAVESAKAQYAEAVAYQKRSQRELERLRNLKASGLATQQQLDDAGSDAAAANARMSSASAQINASEEDLNQISVKLSRTDIKAPISGTVAVRNANVGDMAGGENSAALFTIIDESIYDLNVQIPTVDIAGVKIDNKVDFSVDAYPDKVFTGKVAHINPRVNDSDKAVSVNISVLNSDSLLKSGYFVKAQIYTGESHKAFLVPQSALLGNDVIKKTAKVYVVEKGIAHIRDIKTGKTGSGTVEILDGIQEGETIVIRGGFTIKDGDKVSIVE